MYKGILKRLKQQKRYKTEKAFVLYIIILAGDHLKTV